MMFGSRLAQILVVFACLFSAATSTSADESARSFGRIVDTAESAAAHAVATSERAELSEFRDAVPAFGAPVYSDAFAKPDRPVYRKSSTGAHSTHGHDAGRLGQANASGTASVSSAPMNRTFTVYTCGVPANVTEKYLPFRPGCRVKLVGCPRGDCTHWPIENGLEMEETDVKGVFSVTTDLYDAGDEFAFAVFEGTCTPWEEEYCILKGNCGERDNCDHRYDSGLAFDFKQVACYKEEREDEHHTCAGNSPLYEAPCAKRFVTSGDNYVWYNRVVPSDKVNVSYVWGTCDEAPADVAASCGDNFKKPPCFSMPEVEDPPVCTPEEITAKNDGFVDWSPNLTDPRLADHTGFCASEGVCKNATDRDVLFLLDASASQSAAAFRNHLVPLTKRLFCAAHTTTNSRVGVMIFPGFDADTCNGAQMLIPMGRYTIEEWSSLIDGIQDRCCATATPTAEALMLARDIIKGTNEFGLDKAIVYMISDGGPAMNFGNVDCSDKAEDRYKRLSRWTTDVLGHVPDHWEGIDGEPSDHCHYSFRYVQLYGMLHQMFKSRVVFVGVPNSAGWYPEPAQFTGGFMAKPCFVNATGQFCGMNNVGYGVNSGSTHSSKSHNPDIVERNARGLRVAWGKARSSCVMHNPTIYSFISRPPYANYHNIARWNDPNKHVRPFELMCDPNPCTDPTLEDADEAIKLCAGESSYRNRQQWANTDHCLNDRVYDACRAKYNKFGEGIIDEVRVGSSSVSGGVFRKSFTCKSSTDKGATFVTDGTASVTCRDLEPCAVTWT